VVAGVNVMYFAPALLANFARFRPLNPSREGIHQASGIHRAAPYAGSRSLAALHLGIRDEVEEYPEGHLFKSGDARDGTGMGFIVGHDGSNPPESMVHL